MSNYALSALRALQDGEPRRAYDLPRVAARLPKKYPESEYRKWAKTAKRG